MKFVKINFQFCLVFIMVVFLLTGCSGSTISNRNIDLMSKDKDTAQATKNADNTKKLKIALIMKTLTNPFFVEMEKGARKAESEYNIELIVKTGAQETSIQQQIAIVEEMIASKVDAIVIAPGSSTELIPILKKAQDAKIPIINIDNRLNKELCDKMGLKDVPFISVNNEFGAYQSAKYIAAKATAPTKAAILEGISGTENGDQRKAGAKRAFSENKNVTLVASETANWKIDEAYSVLEKMYEKNPDIGMVFCANDMMALGAIQYLKKTGRNNVLVAGYDALKEAKDALKEGTLQCTIDQQADLQGYNGVMYAIKQINNKPVPPETMLETILVDKSNVK